MINLKKKRPEFITTQILLYMYFFSALDFP